VVALAALPGCRPAAAKGADAAPAVEVAGCAAWVDGKTCEVGAGRELRLWIGPGTGEIHLRVGGQVAAPTTTQPVAGGTLWTVSVPAGAVSIDLEPALASSSALLHLPLAEAPVFAAIEEAKRLRASGDAEGALAALGGVDVMSGDERAAALALRARLRLSAGAVAEAIDDFREAIAARDPRRASERVIDGVTLAFALNQRSHRFAEAKTALAEAAARTGDFPEGRALVAYHGALVAYETGDMRAALAGLGEAAERATRIGDVPLVHAAKEARALALLAMGRRREAIEILTASRRERGKVADCTGADLAIDLSWAWASCGDEDALALCGASPEEALGEAEHAAAEAVAAFPSLCPDPHLTANALVNEALVRLQQGDVQGAQALLDRSRSFAGKPNASVELFLADLQNRVLLANGQARAALSGFERELARADTLLAQPMRWRADVGIAEARERMGDAEGAIAAYAQAEVATAEGSLAIPLGEGRASFVAEHEEATVRHVDLLLRAGRDEEALSVVRRARVGVLEPLQWARDLARLDPAARARWDETVGDYRQQRSALESEAEGEWSLPADEWQRADASRRARAAELGKALDETLSREALARPAATSDALRAPESGETLLVYHRAKDQWVGFARTASDLVVRQLGPVDALAAPEALATSLLEPFAAQILGARRVTVLASGSLRAVDFHALPWRGEPLVERVAVAYGLDLPARPEAQVQAADDRSGRALVVGDPGGDLLAARAEAEAATRALRDGGWVVDAKLRRDARGDVVRSALAGAELLHYAGHGVFSGPDGWESALPLADAAALSVGDLLALPRVPRLVVLAGCETGKSGDAKSAAGLGLAQSLLVAGAEEVLASGRRVDDAMTARVMALVYARPLGAGEVDLVQRLAEAQRALWRSPEMVGWQDLRVIVR
jgi:tetratricopeptide (TPR) repeat protein